MAKKKPTADAPDTSPAYPSRAGYTSCYLPKKLADELKIHADAEDRSLSYMVKRAVEKLLVELRAKPK